MAPSLYRLSAFLPVLAALLFLNGCLGVKTVSTTQHDSPAQVDISRINHPWKGPAAKLAQRGFTQPQLEAVFNSPNLVYSSAPMASKLRELYGIYYRSDLTKEIQEKLYQLGYDILIDGRGGPGTQRAVKKFQTDNKLTANGETSDSTLASINKVMRSKKNLRPLSSYKPPQAQKPSRTATHTQFTSPSALAKITACYKGDLETFQRMSRKYNVPGEVVAAIMLVETGYGSFFGKNKAASMLASMSAAASDFGLVEPEVADIAKDKSSRDFLKETAVKRGDWALNELAALMTYSIQNGHDSTTFPGSIFGAVGWGQFMPSNIAKFGVDGSGDGKVDMFNKADAIFSIGNFLKGHGWEGSKVNSMPEEARRAVIMKYNKSGVYTNTVLYIADHLARQ